MDARTIAAFDNDAMIAAIRGAVSSDVEVLSSRLRPVAGDPGLEDRARGARGGRRRRRSRVSRA